MPASSVSEPLLRYEAFVPLRRQWAIAIGISLLVAGLTVGLSVNHRLHADLRPLPLVISFAEFLAPFVIVGATILFAGRWSVGRSAYVKVFGDRIILSRPSQASTLVLPFENMASFRDGSSDHVELVPREGFAHLPRAYLLVPTPDEETRRKLLALLDAGHVVRDSA